MCESVWLGWRVTILFATVSRTQVIGGADSNTPLIRMLRWVVVGSGVLWLVQLFTGSIDAYYFGWAPSVGSFIGYSIDAYYFG